MNCRKFRRIWRVLDRLLWCAVPVSERIEFVERLKYLQFFSSAATTTVFIKVKFAEIDL